MASEMTDDTRQRAEAVNKLVLEIRDDIGACYFGYDDTTINLPWHGDWVGMLGGYIAAYGQREYQRGAKQALEQYRDEVAMKLQLDHMHRQTYSKTDIIIALDQADSALDALAHKDK